MVDDPPIRDNPLFNSNRLKLGTFCTNTLTNMTLVPERWRPTWKSTVRAAQLADEAGWEALVPLARWKGYLDSKPDHPSHEVLDSFTWAAGIAQATNYSAVFATSHAPTVHPVTAAKQCATIDAISNGRFALNIVAGWNRREFAMFGIELLAHDRRYDYLEEWLRVLRRLWSEPGEIEEAGEYFKMKAAISRPQPLQTRGIPIMNAATSQMGIRFSARNSQIGLISPVGPTSEWAQQVERYKRIAHDEFGREIQIWTNGSLVQGETQQEAEAYLRRYSEEQLDVEALDSIMRTMSTENSIASDSPLYTMLRQRTAVGSGYPIVGTPDRIVEQFQRIADAGIDGVILTWIDYIDGLRKFNRDVMPLLEQAGLRQRFGGAARVEA